MKLYGIIKIPAIDVTMDLIFIVSNGKLINLEMLGLVKEAILTTFANNINRKCPFYL